MRTHTRLGAGIITIQLGAAVLAGSPTSTAATITISPGDRIDYISPTTDTHFCTIGYVYTAGDWDSPHIVETSP